MLPRPARSGTLRDRSAVSSQGGTSCLEGGGQCGDLVGNGLDTLHHRQQLLLLTLQQSILLSQLLTQLGLVPWLHGGQSVLLWALDGTRSKPGQGKLKLISKTVLHKFSQLIWLMKYQLQNKGSNTLTANKRE